MWSLRGCVKGAKGGSEGTEVSSAGRKLPRGGGGGEGLLRTIEALPGFTVEGEGATGGQVSGSSGNFSDAGWRGGDGEGHGHGVC